MDVERREHGHRHQRADAAAPARHLKGIAIHDDRRADDLHLDAEQAAQRAHGFRGEQLERHRALDHAADRDHEKHQQTGENEDARKRRPPRYSAAP